MSADESKTLLNLIQQKAKEKRAKDQGFIVFDDDDLEYMDKATSEIMLRINKALTVSMDAKEKAKQLGIMTAAMSDSIRDNTSEISKLRSSNMGIESKVFHLERRVSALERGSLVYSGSSGSPGSQL